MARAEPGTGAEPGAVAEAAAYPPAREATDGRQLRSAQPVPQGTGALRALRGPRPRGPRGPRGRATPDAQAGPPAWMRTD
ncbi:MAG TPA: hypothetical protein VFB66_10715 [Tepidisphaeraceae bacterium]|nr:hypothetical protein [Tepidisphaeraceae bacterium]